MTDRPLVLVALRHEAAYLSQDVDHALIGAGKVSAAVGAALAVSRAKPSRVLNIGTAGALRPDLEGIHRIGRVAEHDFDHLVLEELTGDRFPGPIVLDTSAPISLVTGDQFVQDDATRALLAVHADLVDMEGYAVARVCQSFGVACDLVKIVSDDAGDAALRSWRDTVDATARTIAVAVADWLDPSG